MPDEPESPAVLPPPPEPVVGESIQAYVPPYSIEAIPGDQPPLPRIMPRQLSQKLEDDPCMNKLKKRMEAAKRAALPSQRQFDTAWIEVVKAYAAWQTLRNVSETAKKEELIIQAEMEKRKLMIRDREETKEIRRMRRYLGARYNHM